MPWYNTLRSSLHALLGTEDPLVPARPLQAVTLEDIRRTMLDLLGEDRSERNVKLTRRIRYASDVDALWYMRGDLMAVLASSRGEARALDEMERLSGMFTQLLPHGLRARPSRLSASYRDRLGAS